MSINADSHDGSLTRRLAASLLAAAITLSTAAVCFAADTIVLRVGDQKGGNRSLLDISGYAKDVPYRIEWSEFPAAAPILEALNAGALDVGYTGDLSFLSVYAAGAPIKAIGGTSPIVIDENVVKEVQEASDRATRYGILPKKLDVSRAVDRSLTAAAAGSN
jgi:sulfonate transport system substrate-binding protein